MTKLRLLIFAITIMVVGILGSLVIFYARGYRFDKETLRFRPNGLLVIKSDPTGAQVFINGDLKTATDTTLSLLPGVYDVSVRKDGSLSWSKRLTVEKEVVTLAYVALFRVAPSLTAVTFEGALNPVSSSDYSKIAYAVPGSGLFLIETADLPLGFSRDPRRLTDGDLTQASWEFSPDGRQIMLTSQFGVFLLDSGSFTPQNARVNISSRKEAVLGEWETLRKNKLSAQLKNLPEELADILQRKASTVTFSPDDTKILYTASSSASLKENLIKAPPGSSTQRQERNIEAGKTYVYDIKEDRNFKVADEGVSVRWFPTSKHLVLAEAGQVIIVDYDGTNRQPVYSGSYLAPHAYPYLNSSKILILTNLGAGASIPNLYSLGLK